MSLRVLVALCAGFDVLLMRAALFARRACAFRRRWCALTRARFGPALGMRSVGASGCHYHFPP